MSIEDDEAAAFVPHDQIYIKKSDIPFEERDINPGKLFFIEVVDPVFTIPELNAIKVALTPAQPLEPMSPEQSSALEKINSVLLKEKQQ